MATETSTSGSLMFDAWEWLRGHELKAPAIDKISPTDRIASVLSDQEDADRLLDDALHINVLQVKWRVQFPPPPFLTLRRPHPNIDGLLAFWPVTPQAISMLPGLRFLKLSETDLPGPTLQTAEILATLPPTLEELWLWTRSLDVEALGRLPKLWLLRAVLDSGSAAHCRSLAKMKQLRVLQLSSHKALNGVNALGRLENLEQLQIERCTRFDFEAFAGCRRLFDLSLGTGVALEGIEVLQQLEHLSVGGRRTMSLAPLKQLPRLDSLGLSTAHAPPDFDVISELTNLKSISLSIGSVDHPFKLKSAAPFANLKRLQFLHCLALLGDRDLTPLAGLKELKYVHFYGAYPADKVRWLQEQLPACKIALSVTP